MKFDRLNSSIALNAREAPSIYMTMCMIESLFRDVEEASGSELSRTPVGDEQLPTKLIWLGRQLLKIYSENSGELLRNRDRLDKMMEKVKEQEASLAEAEGDALALHEAQTRFSALEKQLHEAESARQESLLLEEQSRKIKERLKLLEEIKPEAVRAELDQLSAREKELTARRVEMKQALEKQYDAVSALELACDELEATAEQYRGELDKLQSDKKKTEGEIDGLREDIERMENELSLHSGEKDQLIEEQAFLEDQLTLLRKDVEDYERDHMAPLRTEYAEKNAQRDGLKAELDELKRSRDDAVLQVARLTQQVSVAKHALEEKQKLLQQRQEAAQLSAEQAEQLQQQLGEETNRLAELQERAADLEHNQLPQLQALIQEQEKQKKQFEDSISGLEERKEKLLLEVDRLEKDDAALAAEVAELKETHDALVASSEANDEAVRTLRQNVEELRGRNDQEKETRYRQQLEEEKEKLLSLGQTCDELERQLTASRSSLDKKQLQLNSLQGKKQTLDEEIRKVNALVQGIAPLGDAALQRRITSLQNRRHLLESSYQSLEEALGMMQSVLNLPAGSLGISPEGLSESLQQCGRALDKLQKSVVKCAGAVQSEINVMSSGEEQV